VALSGAAHAGESIKPIECPQGPTSCVYVDRCVTEDCRKRVKEQDGARINQSMDEIRRLIEETSRRNRR
jgi:hypothetical protein